MTGRSDTKLKDSLRNYEKALKSLREAVETPVEEDRDRAGIIKNFEFVYELSWLALKRVLAYEGKETTTPRSVFSVAYQEGLIGDEAVWLKMIEDRNLTVHTYDAKMAEKMMKKIVKKYFPVSAELFAQLKKKYS